MHTNVLNAIFVYHLYLNKPHMVEEARDLFGALGALL